MNAVAILFPLGVRLSTWLAAVAFVSLAIARRDRKPLIAGAAWLTGFEAVFQIASLALDRLPLGLLSPIFFLTLAAVTLAWAYRRGVSPDYRLIVVALVLVGVWMVTGFHLNGHQHGMFDLHTRIAHFDVSAEILNELAKTLWAAAYLVPLLRIRRLRPGRVVLPQAP